MSNHSCSVAASQRGSVRFQAAPYLHFVHNQQFHPMKGTPAAGLAMTRQIKSCDMGSDPQATLHLQMSGNRVTHAGETLCCVTPSELFSFPSPRRVFLMLNNSNVTCLGYLYLCLKQKEAAWVSFRNMHCFFWA